MGVGRWETAKGTRQPILKHYVMISNVSQVTLDTKIRNLKMYSTKYDKIQNRKKMRCFWNILKGDFLDVYLRKATIKRASTTTTFYSTLTACSLLFIWVLLFRYLSAKVLLLGWLPPKFLSIIWKGREALEAWDCLLILS